MQNYNEDHKIITPMHVSFATRPKPHQQPTAKSSRVAYSHALAILQHLQLRLTACDMNAWCACSLLDSNTGCDNLL